jgi:hypothetical protein
VYMSCRQEDAKMSDTKEIHQLEYSEFKDMIARLSLEDKRSIIPDLNKYLALRKLTWSLLKQSQGSFVMELPLEAQFTYSMLVSQVEFYDNQRCDEVLIDVFKRIKENEEINLHEVRLYI